MVAISAFPKCWLDDISEGKMELTAWIDMAPQVGCEGLELYGRFLASHDPEYLDAIRQRVETLGMTIPMMCYSPDFTQADPAARRREVEAQKRMIRVSKRLGCGTVRILSGQRRPGVSREDGVRWVVECINACLPAAEEHGIVLAMENHYKDGPWLYPEFAQRIEIFLEIVDRIDSPWFGVQYDPSNTLVANEDPLELLDRVAPRVVTMHASDRYLLDGYDREEVLSAAGRQGYHPALQHGVIGKGLNDYPAIFAKLKAVGFDGWISVEDGMNGLGEMRESVDFLKAMRSRFFGE